VVWSAPLSSWRHTGALCDIGKGIGARFRSKPSTEPRCVAQHSGHTGAKYAQDIRQVSGSVSIVTAEDIQRFGYRTLLDVLQSMAGIYISYERTYAQVAARGFRRPTDFNNRILLLIDGHSTNESMWGSAFLGDELVLNLRRWIGSR
jgi:outer membrane receptor for ferrienterochelin and colicin